VGFRPRHSSPRTHSVERTSTKHPETPNLVLFVPKLKSRFACYRYGFVANVDRQVQYGDFSVSGKLFSFGMSCGFRKFYRCSSYVESVIESSNLKSSVESFCRSKHSSASTAFHAACWTHWAYSCSWKSNSTEGEGRLCAEGKTSGCSPKVVRFFDSARPSPPPSYLAFVSASTTRTTIEGTTA
jgi:hypothetical protein